MRTTTYRTRSWRPSRLPEHLAPAPPDARVLGVDPGLVATGYAVLAAAPGRPALLDMGVVETRPDVPLEERLDAIHGAVAGLLDKHAPTAMAVEDLYSEYRFPRTALLMAHARGVVYLAARRHDVAVLALSPAEVKRVVAAHGAASKEQVQHAMRRLLDLPELPRPSHVADALALAFAGLARLGRVR